jgi:FkbM family methyltransferase
MTVREWVIKILRKVGGALSGTLHDRLAEHEGILYRLGSQLDRVNSEVADLSSQSQNLAENHTALLQSSIRTVELMQSRVNQIDESASARAASLLEKIERSNTQHNEMIQSLLARIDSSDATANSQRSILQSRVDQITESLSSLSAPILETIEQSSIRQNEMLQALRARIDASDSAGSSQQSMLQARMDQIDEAARSRTSSILEKLEQSYNAQNELLQALLAKIEVADSSAGAERSMLQSRLDQVGESLSSRVGSILESIEQSYNLQSNFMQAVLARINSSASAERQQETIEAFDRLRGYISEQADHLRTALENEVVQQVCIETSDYSLANPEIGLISFLYSYLPNRRVIDIGAHNGEFSDALLSAGYEVYAVEPAPALYEQLIGRLAGRDGFHPFEFALGSSEGEMSLHSATDLTDSHVYGDTTVLNTLAPHGMPDGLPFTASTTVPVRTLKNLHKEGLIPKEVGLVKIDTEGFDLEVIRGMEEHRYPVVAAEYWDSEIPFGKSGLLYTLGSLVAEMRNRGYLWHAVLFRVWGRNQIGYYCNHDRSVPNSWGNIFFFRDHAVFEQAQMWCSAVLPRTYFKASVASAVSAETDVPIVNRV